MSLKQFIQKNRQFWWYVKDPLKLDDKAVVEGVIKCGDMKEIRQLMKILGAKHVAKIFLAQSKAKRANYDVKTINYFRQYFKLYAK